MVGDIEGRYSVLLVLLALSIGRLKDLRRIEKATLLPLLLAVIFAVLSCEAWDVLLQDGQNTL